MAEIDQKFIRIIRGNVRQVVYPTKIIKQIVNEIESDVLLITDAVEKYGVTRVTVVNWLKRYSDMSEDQYMRKKWSKDKKRQIVAEIEQGAISKKESAKKYKVDISTISIWIKNYSCNLIIKKQEMRKQIKTDDRGLSVISKENGDLKLTVNELKLKVASLEMMIDVAENELNIEIRKKSGIKQ